MAVEFGLKLDETAVERLVVVSEVGEGDVSLQVNTVCFGHLFADAGMGGIVFVDAVGIESELSDIDAIGFASGQAGRVV